MKIMFYNESAIKITGMVSIAANKEEKQKPVLVSALSLVKQKPFLPEFRFIEHSSRVDSKAGFFIAVKQRYSTLSAATLHAESRQAIPIQAGFLSMPESARKTKQVNPFMTLASSNRKLHLISERGFQIANAITVRHMLGHMDA